MNDKTRNTTVNAPTIKIMNKEIKSYSEGKN